MDDPGWEKNITKGSTGTIGEIWVWTTDRIQYHFRLFITVQCYIWCLCSQEIHSRGKETWQSQIVQEKTVYVYVVGRGR